MISEKELQMLEGLVDRGYTLGNFYKDLCLDVWDIEDFLEDVGYKIDPLDLDWQDRGLIREVLEYLESNGLIFRLFEEMKFLGIKEEKCNG